MMRGYRVQCANGKNTALHNYSGFLVTYLCTTAHTHTHTHFAAVATTYLRFCDGRRSLSCRQFLFLFGCARVSGLFLFLFFLYTFSLTRTTYVRSFINDNWVAHIVCYSILYDAQCSEKFVSLLLLFFFFFFISSCSDVSNDRICTFFVLSPLKQLYIIIVVGGDRAS